MINVSIKLDGLELYPKFIQYIPDITLTKGDIGNFSTLPNLSLTLNNNRGVFSEKRDSSIFFGKTIHDIQNMPLVIMINDKVICSGYPKGFPIIDVRTNTATLDVMTILDKTFSVIKIAEYYNPDYLTPSEMLKLLLTKYNFQDYVDDNSFSHSRELQEIGSLSISSNIYSISSVDLFSCIQELASLQCAKIFVDNNGLIHNEVYNPLNVLVSAIEINENWYNNLIITPTTRIPYDQYSIETLEGTATIPSIDYPKNTLSDMQYGTESIFQISQIIGGFYVGDTYITQSQDQQTLVEFDIDPRCLDYFDFGQNIRLVNSEENINNIIDITEMSLSGNLQNIHLKGIIHGS
jgi:hypothetical protein